LIAGTSAARPAHLFGRLPINLHRGTINNDRERDGITGRGRAPSPTFVVAPPEQPCFARGDGTINAA
jgi:hypothetical protein